MTIKELSKVCGVSEQAIRGWCRKNQVAKATKATKARGFVIDETTERAILQYYGAENAKATKGNETKVAKACESNSETIKMLEILQKELDFCKKQMEAKDEQIVTLQKSLQSATETLQSTTKALNIAQESVRNAQVLQANTEKKLIDQNSDRVEIIDSDQHDQQEKKQWWKFWK